MYVSQMSSVFQLKECEKGTIKFNLGDNALTSATTKRGLSRCYRQSTVGSTRLAA